jgi:acetyltransferase-like isoleucine patch superfamily enzyme
MNHREIKPHSDLHSLNNYLLHGIYLLCYSFFKYLSFPLSNYLRFIVVFIFSKGKIKSTYLSDGVLIMFPWRVSIGRRCSLNQGVSINGYGGVRIGNGVRIAAYSSINSVDHQFDDKNTFIMDQGMVMSSVSIDDDVWLGNSVHVNRGVHIGKGCIIGTNSVVTKNIPPFSVAVGSPARIIKSR